MRSVVFVLAFSPCLFVGRRSLGTTHRTADEHQQNDILPTGSVKNYASGNVALIDVRNPLGACALLLLTCGVVTAQQASGSLRDLTRSPPCQVCRCAGHSRVQTRMTSDDEDQWEEEESFEGKHASDVKLDPNSDAKSFLAINRFGSLLHITTFFAKRLRPEASLPRRSSQLAAGLDISAAEETVVPKGSKAIVKTALSIAVPQGTYARLAPRSGLAAKHMIDVGAGVVDSDYRGEVGVVLFNHGQDEFVVKVGDRVAQLVVEQVNMNACQEVENLDAIERGSGDFGRIGVEESVEASPEKKQCVESEKSFRVKRLQAEASLPARGSEFAAGFDLAAAEAVVVPAGGKAIAKTGLSVAVPLGTYGRIAPRSGLAAKRMILCGAGVVDADYRGEVGVVLFNFGPEDFVVNVGDRVAQMILEEIAMLECKEVEGLDDTERGAGGFGSTGISQQSSQELSSAQASGTTASALLVKRLTPEAKLPVRGSVQAAGFDLSASVAVSVPAHGKAIVKTGLSIATPLGTYARIAPRTGLAAKHMLHCGAGVVDADYRGEVGVVLFNHGSNAFEVAVGDRVAQLILEKIAMLECVETTSLEDTLRGADGLGSTGITSAPDGARNGGEDGA